jgi:hypothetical protein
MNPYVRIADAIVGIDPQEGHARLVRACEGERIDVDDVLEAVGIGMAIERLEGSMRFGCYAALTTIPWPGVGAPRPIVSLTDTHRVQRMAEIRADLDAEYEAELEAERSRCP